MIKSFLFNLFVLSCTCINIVPDIKLNRRQLITTSMLLSNTIYNSTDSTDSTDRTDKKREIGFMDLPLETRKKIVPKSLLGSNYEKISLFEQGLNEQRQRRNQINNDLNRNKYNLFNLMNTINLYKELVKIDSNIEARRNNLARLKELQQLYITMQRDINIDDKSSKK